jgi:hypothetical protein
MRVFFTGAEVNVYCLSAAKKKATQRVFRVA